MTVILDCNVVVSAAWNGGICLSVVRHCVERDLLAVSPAIIGEYRRVAGYPKLARIRHRLTVLIDEIEAAAYPVDEAPVSFILPDPGDLIYLAAGTGGDVQVIVTGNLRDFPDRNYGLVRVLSVREFADAEGIG